MSGWRYRCPNCGSVGMRYRVTKIDYYCDNCKKAVQKSERVDMEEEED